MRKSAESAPVAAHPKKHERTDNRATRRNVSAWAIQELMDLLQESESDQRMYPENQLAREPEYVGAQHGAGMDRAEEEKDEIDLGEYVRDH